MPRLAMNATLEKTSNNFWYAIDATLTSVTPTAANLRTSQKMIGFVKTAPRRLKKLNEESSSKKRDVRDRRPCNRPKDERNYES